MEIDSPLPSPRDRILQRLGVLGVPLRYIEELHPGLVAFLRDEKAPISELVSALLPSDDELAKVFEDKDAKFSPSLTDLYQESLVWLQWLMFEGEPAEALENLASMNDGQRGVCGAIWGKDEIAFCCRTCEHDPTCAICVPCFQNGNHEDHDYSIIYTVGGCCDCGDETAWNPEGFCANHRGSEKMQPLPENVAQAVGPVLDSLFWYWKEKLIIAEGMPTENQAVSDHALDIGNELTSAIVDMLQDFCMCSESLLTFVSGVVINSFNLLNILIRVERFLNETITKKLHDLLLKLQAEPIFKYEVGKLLVYYYPVSVQKAIEKSSDTVLDKDTLLSTFSVQIFTVPTLTLRLVKEENLLVILLECLGNILISCSGDDGRLQMDKWVNLHEPSHRVIGDLKFVLSHAEVAEYATHEKRDICRAWLKILSYVQGMNPQKRETGIDVEDENEDMDWPFRVCHSIAKINFLLVAGTFAVSSVKETCHEAPGIQRQDGDSEVEMHARVAKASHQGSVCTFADQSRSLRQTTLDGDCMSTNNQISISSSALWLEAECLRALASWLEANSSAGVFDVTSSDDLDVHMNSDIDFEKPLSKFRKGNKFFRLGDHSLPLDNITCSKTVAEDYSTDGFVTVPSRTDFLAQSNVHPDSEIVDAVDMDLDGCLDQTYLLNSIKEEPMKEPESFSFFNLSLWPSIDYDVSSQEISFHIPLHGFLASILKEILRKCCGDTLLLDTGSSNCTDLLPSGFFGRIFRGIHPYGFSSFIMEHPLRLRVVCAQVQAGMWKKNGEDAFVSCEWYNSVRWSDHKLELDLFLLQFCAAVAPPDAYVRRILERFGLSSYISFDLEEYSEYEPVLVQEMLTLIIQIIKERRFCGLSVSENLQRELVCRLAVGDATHSQLVNSLPPEISKSHQLQEIVDKIAKYSKPSQFRQGKYSLRYSFWNEFDLYHPRWKPRDLQIAQERYLHFSGACALNTQLPKWTKIYQPLHGISRVATCNMVLQIIRAVIFYHIFSNESDRSRAPEDVLVSALHLLSLGLDVCSHHYRFGCNPQIVRDQIPLLAFAGEEIRLGLYEGAAQQSLLSLLVLLLRMHKKENSDSYVEAGNLNLPSLLENLLKKFAEMDTKCMRKLQHLAPEVIESLCKSSHSNVHSRTDSVSGGDKRKVKAREKQAAMLAKIKAEQSKFLASLNADADVTDEPKDEKGQHGSDAGTDFVEGKHHACSLCHNSSSEDPISFLVHLQKSRLVSFVNKVAPARDQDWKSNFDKEKAAVTHKKTGDPAGRSISKASPETLSSSRWSQLAQKVVLELSRDWNSAEVGSLVVFLQSKMPELKNVEFPFISNSMKKETAYSFESMEQEMLFSIEKHMGRIASGLANISDDTNETTRKVTSSFLLGKYLAALPREATYNLEDPKDKDPYSLESAEPFSPPKEFGPTGCDGIHLSSCGHAVHQSCLDRYLSSLKDRYMRRINFEGGHIVNPDQGEFLCPVCRRLANSILPAVARHCSEQLEQPTSSIAGPPCYDDVVTASSEKLICLQLKHAYSLLSNGSSVVLKDANFRVNPIEGHKRIGRNLEPAFRVLSGMYFPGKDSFCKSGRASPSLLMWDMLKYSLVSTEIAARSGRTSISTTTLDPFYKELKSSNEFALPLLLSIVQRTRSRNPLDVLLRFIGMQCFGSSICFGVSPKEGEMMSLLKHIDADESFPDTRFWNEASVPVLTRDPFSTLMWLLFCLPHPILSFRESFVSLVHMFYAVSVIQALVVYIGSRQNSGESFGFHDCLVTDVRELVRVSPGLQKYFVSNYVDPDCNMKDMIYSFCLPYLRRCALLRKLLSASMSPLRPHVDHILDITRDIDHKVVADFAGDHAGISELENMFAIPPLDDVLCDGFLRSLTQKWFKHVHTNFEHYSSLRVLHLTPFAPFQLMRLPHVYQDLLQRYIKSWCPDCEAVQEDPALCLLCGRLCSLDWKSCCRESECTTHSMSCGAGTGVFLLIRRTSILLERNARQALWASPYLDAFGEEDADMRRGKPLYLNEERYAALTSLVASHGLDRCSAVLKRTTIGPLFML
ncbi:hypothetical protein Droror1_Dr00026073 [Drosera rotundifolia]